MSNKSIAKQPNPLAPGIGIAFFGALSILMGVFVAVLGIVRWYDNLSILINTFVNCPALVILGICLLVLRKSHRGFYPLPAGPFKDISDRIHGTLYGLLCGFFILGMIATIVLNIVGVYTYNTAVVYSALSTPLPVALIFFYGRLLLEYHSKKDYLAIEQVEILKELKGAPAPEESAPEI